MMTKSRQPVSRFAALALLFVPAVARAQQLIPNYFVPVFRGAAGAEYSEWDSFYDPYLGDNLPTLATNVANPDYEPTIVQVGTPSPPAIITTWGGIYSYGADPTVFELHNDTSATITSGSDRLTNIVFQFYGEGLAMDLESFTIEYKDSSNVSHFLEEPFSFITEYRLSQSIHGGYLNRAAYQWDVTGLDIQSYTLHFAATAAHNSLKGAILDVSTTPFAEMIPTARTWTNAGADNRWSTAANWSGGTVSSPGGNVTISGGTSIDLDTPRETGMLTFTQPGALTVGSSTGATLKVNSGIYLRPGAGDVTFDTNLYGGGHFVIETAAGTTMTINGTMSGAPEADGFSAVGLSKEGGGTLRVTGDLAFGGSVLVWGGDLVLSGNNSYTGVTEVDLGRLIVKGDSRLTGGVLGTTSRVTVGNSLYEPAVAAELLIEGGHTIENIIAVGGSVLDAEYAGPEYIHSRVLGARETGPGGALFSGQIVLQQAVKDMRFRAEGAGDVVTFSGKITGGASATDRVVRIDGAGTVVFSGGDKTYANPTTVSSGSTLVLDAKHTGSGNYLVESGAKLNIGPSGSLQGNASAQLEIVSGGKLSGSGAVTRQVVARGGSLLATDDDTLTLGALAASFGARFEMHLGDPQALQLDITGLFTHAGGAGGLLFSFLGGEAGVVYDLIDFGSSDDAESWLAAFALDPASAYVLDASFGEQGWHLEELAEDRYRLQAQFLAVPEPGVLGLLFPTILAGLARRRPRYFRAVAM